MAARQAELTFRGPLEEHLAAAAGEGAVVTARGLVSADKTGPLGREEELHRKHVLPLALISVTARINTHKQAASGSAGKRGSGI